MGHECPICFKDDLQEEVSIQPCDHKMCRRCACACLCAFGNRCPMCKGFASGIMPWPLQTPPKVVLRVLPHEHLGLTLQDDALGRGVVVSSLHAPDVATRHLALHTVIRMINGVPVVHHRDAISLINTAIEHGSSVALWTVHDRVALWRSNWTLRLKAKAFHLRRRRWTDGHTNQFT